MSRTSKIVVLMFWVIGLGSIFLSYKLFDSTHGFVRNGVVVEGEVVDVHKFEAYRQNNTYHPDTYQAKFGFTTTDGKNFTFLDRNVGTSQLYQQGDKVQVVYDPKDLNKVSLKSNSSLYFGAYLAIFIGVVFFLIGCVPVLYIRRRNKQIEKLKSSGTKIVGTIEKVDDDTGTIANGKRAFCIHVKCTFPDGSHHRVHSDDIWFDPSLWAKVGAPIDVYVDTHSQKHYVDISFLPKMNV